MMPRFRLKTRLGAALLAATTLYGTGLLELPSVEAHLGADVSVSEGGHATVSVCWVTAACLSPVTGPQSQTFTYATPQFSLCQDFGTFGLGVPCGITGSGNYVNLVCGTGLIYGTGLQAIQAVAPPLGMPNADSIATVTNLADPNGQHYSLHNLNVLFAAGVGLLFAQEGPTNDATVGLVSFTPQGLPPLPQTPTTSNNGGHCTDGFNVQLVALAT